MTKNTKQQTPKIILTIAVVAILIIGAAVYSSQNTNKQAANNKPAVTTQENLASGIVGATMIGSAKKATVIVEDMKANKITQFTSNEKGYFKVFLKPGIYNLRPANKENAKPLLVFVPRNKFSYVLVK